MRLIWIGILAGALSLAACGGKKEDKGKTGTEAKKGAPAGADKAAVDKGGDKGGGDAAAAEAVNKLVPADLADKLTFTTAKGEDGRFVAVVPKGWEEAKHMPGHYRPTGSDLGFMTSFDVGTNCDGDCAPKDWAATTEKVEFKQFLEGDQFEVVKDEKGDDSRLMVAKSGDKIYIAAVQWKEGASRYFTCRATLEKEIAAAAPAFEQACRSVSISSW